MMLSCNGLKQCNLDREKEIHKPYFHGQEQSCLCTSTQQVERPQETKLVSYNKRIIQVITDVTEFLLRMMRFHARGKNEWKRLAVQ